MARIPDAFIDDLLARTDIVEVIHARVPLKRQGKEYSARCPFHDERSPSFTVSPTKQFYHCFGCGAHGTAISFLMNYDRLEFLDAVDELAKRAGMEVPRDTQQRNANPDVQDLFNALEAAARFFQRQLAASDKASAYLDGRGVGEAVRAQFMLGYAPDGYSALKDALGTAISFLMNYDRLEFLDAVDELAKRAGMEVPRDTQQRNANPDVQDLFNALEAAARFFQRQLAASDRARTYLDGRGVGEAVRAQFMLGYAPDGYSALKDALGTDERRMKLLDRAGLFSKNDRGHVYDKFRDRAMFPIHDRRGRVIAFGGRVLDKDASPKYLNSPETELFHKGRELYGLWQVRQANTKIERLIVVEGYMDVIALFDHGVTQAVATLGTATTPDHAELLFRNAPDVYFCFDGDRAGRSAAWKAVESVLPRMRDGRQAFFLFLPEGEDPDSIVRHEGAPGFDTRLQHAVPLSQFFFDTLSDGIALSTLDGKARLAERARPLLAQIPDGAFGDLMQQRLTELTGVGARQPAPDASAPIRRSGSRPLAPPKRSLVRSAISLLLQQPSLALDLAPPYRFVALRQPGVELLTELIALVSMRPDITTGALLEHFEGRDEGPALQKLASQSLPGDEPAWREEFIDAIAQLDRQTLQQRIDELQQKWKEGGSPSALTAEEHAELRELQGMVSRRN